MVTSKYRLCSIRTEGRSVKLNRTGMGSEIVIHVGEFVRNRVVFGPVERSCKKESIKSFNSRENNIGPIQSIIPRRNIKRGNCAALEFVSRSSIV